MVYVDLSSDLKKRLLFSSIGLAVIVSIIFIAVAFNLSRDLGRSLEFEHTNHMLLQLSSRVNSITDTEKFNNFFANEDAHNDLKELMGKEVIGIEIWLNETYIKLKSSPVYSQNKGIINAIQTGTSSHGFIEDGVAKSLWIYKKFPIDNLSILIVSKTYALDKAISYVSNRLFITSFLTFWLTVWVALFLSDLITKRFDKSNKKLQFLATHDVLTGLPNRSYLYQHEQSYLNTKNIEKHRSLDTLLALYIIELDKFKNINNSMSHLEGDQLLKIISTRLINLKEKNLKVIRYGEDEFVILCDNLNKRRSISLAAEIVKVCSQPIKINDYSFEINVSVGVSYYPHSGMQFNDLLKNANIAMYYAKSHRLGFQVFQEEIFARSEFRINLRGELNKALKEGQFVLHYQPKVQLPSKNIVGVEALVRWEHPIEGLLGPNMFIDIIEQSLFVNEFTRYVLLQAIIQCRAWLDIDIKLSIAVNISPYNLMDPLFVSYIKSQLKHYALPAELIEIELTENASMVSIEKTQEVFSQLRELGVKLSIDDFGTGMSSLAYIKQLDVDYIKIDRSFIIDLADDKRDEAVIASLLMLCKNLNKLTIAEGVETIEQANILIRLGCNLAQGYLYSKPLPINELNKLLTKQNNNLVSLS